VNISAAGKPRRAGWLIVTSALALASAPVSWAQSRVPGDYVNRSPFLARNRARTADLLGFYGTGRVDRPGLSFLGRGSPAGIYDQMRGSPAEFLRRRSGLGIERNASSVLRSSTFPGLEPARRFQSRYMEMVSPADALTFRDRLVRTRHAPYSDYALAAIAGQSVSSFPADPGGLPSDTAFSQVTLGLEAEVQSSCERKIADGWALLRGWAQLKPDEDDTGEARRAARAFETAESLNRTHTEPRIGRLYAALAQGNITLAGTLLKRIYAYDGLQLQRELFGDDWDLAKALGPGDDAADHVTQIVRMCEAFARGINTSDGHMAVYAFVLWHADRARRPEAIGLAADVARTWPDSPFAELVTLMRQAGERSAATAP